jgi:tetratricopeptide (TPR) repeat protein
MELSDELYEKVTNLSDKGNDALDHTNYTLALALFQQGMDLLPEPKIHWEAYTWFKASMADAYFHQSDFENCMEAAFDALNGPDAVGNPFIHLRLGQALFELSQMKRAEDELLRAYMLAGKDIFSEDDPKYLKHISKKFKIKPD